MSNVRYGLLCWGRANKKCINYINALINRELRCVHYKNYDDSVEYFKTEKKDINVESLYLYESGLLCLNLTTICYQLALMITFKV